MNTNKQKPSINVAMASLEKINLILSSGALRAMEETQRIRNYFVPAGTHRVMQEVYQFQDHSMSSAAQIAMEEARSVWNRFVPAGTHRLLEEAYHLQDHLTSSDALRIIEETHQTLGRFVPAGNYRVMEEAYQVHDRLMASGLLKNLAETQKLNSKLALTFLSNVCKIGGELSNINLHINPDGTITDGTETIDKSKIETAIESCILSEPPSNLSREIVIYNYLDKIKKQHPLIILILLVLILPFLNSICTNIITANYFGSNRQLIVKQIKKEVQAIHVKDNFIQEYRFVAVENLNIRKRNSINSEIIGQIHLGQLVRIIQKHKNWTLVEYQSKDGQCVIKGWAFTRYLEKFKN